MGKFIEELDLTARSYQCLKRYGINTVDELVSLTEEEASKIRNMGARSLLNIKDELSRLGLALKETEANDGIK